MAKRFMSMKNLQFMLHELIGKQKKEQYKIHDNYSQKSSDLILKAAFEFAKTAMFPIFEDMDRHPPEFSQGTVAVHQDVRTIMETLGNDGWIAAIFPEEWGGESMPATLFHSVNYIFTSANYSLAVYSQLTTGAARLIYTFGSEHLKKNYLPYMLKGKWQGTMALTEPDAGSSLGDLATSAKPLKNGTYLMTGEKIFISAGDHTGVDNIVHLMLGRINNAPAGVKGISLFLVPKLRIDENGKLIDNDVTVSQIFHKMGYKGAPITALNIGEKNNCLGYLVGEANKGLSYMFQMMNSARLDVGVSASGIATAAYHAALDYVKIRKQGRKLSDKKADDQVPIINHQDIKRMLFFQRGVSEGGLSLILQCGLYEELSLALPEKKEEFELLLDLLTPVAKSFPAEMGILSTSQSIQCFGGYGFCDDFPVEQHFRDMRIHAIHEGTTGIQGLDLLGRKVRIQDGKALILLFGEMEKTISNAKNYPELKENSEELSTAIATIRKTTDSLKKIAMEYGEEAYLSNSTLYLEMFSYFVIAWLWLAQSIIALEKLSKQKQKKSDKNFYEGKLKVADYFFSNELPKIISLSQILTRKKSVALSARVEHFTN